jgi:hypothetical protein
MNDGTPAFPSPGIPYYSPEGIPLNPSAGYGWAHEPQSGMSLRDYFAGQVLASDKNDYLSVWENDDGAKAFLDYGQKPGGPGWKCTRTPKEAKASAAYAMADAMIAARAGKVVDL